jgi:hypothetical protein
MVRNEGEERNSRGPATVTGMTITRVSGDDGEHEVIEHYRGSLVVLESKPNDRCRQRLGERPGTMWRVARR